MAFRHERNNSQKILIASTDHPISDPSLTEVIIGVLSTAKQNTEV